MNAGEYLLWLAGAFLSGSIPFAVLLGRMRGVDIRQVGSGNPGATNLGRAVGRRWGFLCFALDVLKGLVPVLLPAAVAFDPFAGAGGDVPAALQWVGLAAAAVAGHVLSPWLGFRGGKGVATGLGAALGLFPIVTLPAVAALGVWYATARATGYVGLASVVAAAALPALTLVNGLVMGVAPQPLLVYLALTAVLAAIILVRHRGNLTRLRAGTEPKAAWTGKA